MIDKYGNGKLGLYDPGLHIFVDDREVRYLQNVTRRWGRPRKREAPVLKPELPHEGTRTQVGSVHYDPNLRKFRCWYMTSVPDQPDMGSYICYAESDDGITWIRPELDLHPFRGSKKNNIVLTIAGMEPLDGLIGGYTVRHDDDPDPSRRYKMFCYLQDSRMFSKPELWRTDHYVYTSPDGIHFTKKGVNTNVGSTSDRYGFAWDQKRKLWMAMVGLPCPNGWMRLSGFKESADLQTWTEAIQPFVIQPEEFFGYLYDHHTLYPFLYGNQYLGLFDRYHKPGFIMENELISSRDGRHWERPMNGKQFHVHSPDGAWDDWWIYHSPSPPVPVGDELWFYYQGNTPQTPHPTVGMSTGLITLRRDGFAGLLNATKEPDKIGVVLTEPVDVVGPNLYLNLLQLNACEFKVELRDVHFVHIKGFEMEACEPVTESGLRVKVRWKDKPDLRELVGRRVMVNFQYKWANLFAYKFGE